jgi:hypothetical protein
MPWPGRRTNIPDVFCGSSFTGFSRPMAPLPDFKVFHQSRVRSLQHSLLYGVG